MNGFDFILEGTLAAATPMLLAALGELVVERSGVLNLGLEGLMAVGAALAFITVYSYDSHAMGFAVAAFGGAALAMVFGAVVLGFGAGRFWRGRGFVGVCGCGVGIARQSGGGGAGNRGAGAGAFVPDRKEVRKPDHHRPAKTVAAAAVGSALCGATLYAGHCGLADRPSGSRDLGRSEPFQAGPDHPRRGRKPACRPRHRLSGAKGALCGDWLWRCDGGGCRGLCRDRLHPALGRWHDRGARLDRACAGGIRHMANGPRGVWRAAVRGAVLGRVGSPGRRHRPAVASAGQYPLCRNDPDAGGDLVEPPSDAVEHHRLIGTTVRAVILRPKTPAPKAACGWRCCSFGVFASS